MQSCLCRAVTGRYDVYINVWEEALSFKGGVTVEVYLGNGVSTCMVDVVPCDLTVSSPRPAPFSSSQLSLLFQNPPIVDPVFSWCY